MSASRSTRNTMMWLAIGSSLEASVPSLDGRVVEFEGSGKAGVTVTLIGKALSVQTDIDGKWQLGQALGIQARQASVPTEAGRIFLQAGHLRPSIEGRDPSGRRTQEAAPPRSIAAGATCRAMAVPDTLAYSFGGQVFLRDTISALVQTGIVREFDTTVNVSIIHGYLEDRRDGHAYRTVKIGSQVWMAQNLRLVVDSSWIPGGDVDSGARYGRLYNWPTVMALDPSLHATQPNGTNQPIRGICPEGWHLPSRAEWAALDTFVGGQLPITGRDLRSKDGWFMGMIRAQLTDRVGFKGMPAGHRDTTGTYRDFHFAAGWWSASDTTETSAWTRLNTADYVSGGGNFRLWEEFIDKREGLPVRCIEN
jgi:uncharacterized protein (TIGR02145 family)